MNNTLRSTLRKGKFIIHDLYDHPLNGWTDGTLWNGWATPLFDYAEAARIIDAHNNVEPFDKDDPGRAWYDAEGDQFCFVLAGSDGEIECYPALEREVQSRILRMYPIGAWSWVWEEVDSDEVSVATTSAF